MGYGIWENFPCGMRILDQESWALESGIQLKESGKKVPLKKTLWNTECGKIFLVESGILDQESLALESGIELKESGIKTN